MGSFAIYILFLFSLDMWLATTALVAVMTGIARINGRDFHREKEPYEFWISVTSRTFAAIVFFFYLVSVFVSVGAIKPQFL
jgi:ABC-type iron transport system FetAB permease component